MTQTVLSEVSNDETQVRLEEQVAVEQVAPAEQVPTVQRRGIMWILGAFIICPCHLPFTLGLLATLFGGTTLGLVLQQYPVIAGLIITIVWAAGTWRGFRYLRATNSLKSCQLKRR